MRNHRSTKEETDALRHEETTEPTAVPAGGMDDLRHAETMAPPAADPRAPYRQETIPLRAPVADGDNLPYHDTAPAPPDLHSTQPGRPDDAPIEAPNRAEAPPAGAYLRRVTDKLKDSEFDDDGPASVERLRKGHVIGKYELVREIGRGGMGAVWLARDTRLGRLIALKVLHVQGEQLNRRFITEARTTARCHHENIVVIYEADEYAGSPYMALEYIEGMTLRQLLEESGSGLPVARTVELMLPVVRALARAHSMGIVHRDLKPENVMLTRDGAIKVLDFGIAKLLSDDSRPRGAAEFVSSRYGGAPLETHGLIGTLPYMSPEQIAGGLVDHRTDIWAAGIMLFEMVAGRHPLTPFSPGKFEQVAELDVPMPRVSDVRPDIGALGNIIDRCLIKHKHDRISQARELLAELEPLMASLHGTGLSEDECPFAGLAAFQESDADRFFGRERDIAGVVTRVRSQPLVAVVGPSGVGKSSLVRAGVIPTLKRSGEGWEALIVRPGRDPMAALADLLAQLDLRTSTAREGGGRTRHGGAARRVATELDRGDRADVLARLTSEPGYLGTELRAWADRKLRKLIIFVDQFEEIFTQGSGDKSWAEQRRAFLSCLAAVADDPSSPLRVMFSMRSDFLERLAEYRSFMAAASPGLIFLTPIDRAGLRDALTRPVKNAGYRFESAALVEDMLDALENTPGALPLLQFAATTLWAASDREHRVMTAEAYEAMGGVAGALARHADEVLATMSAREVRQARAVFQRLVTPERTRAIATVAELRQLPGDPDQIEEVVCELADARLLVVESSSGVDRLDSAAVRGDGSVEIVHESLIDSWPTLHRWLDENQDDAEFLARLRHAAEQWERSDRARGTLWRGEVAGQARRWRDKYQGEMAEREQHYLAAIFREEDRSLRRRRRLLYGAMGMMLALLVAAAVVILLVRDKNAKIEHQVDELSEVRDDLQASLQKAEEARTEAERLRQEAERSREEADDKRKEAEDAKADAERARDAARESERAARAQRTRAVQAAASERAARQKAADARREAVAQRSRAEKAADEADREKRQKQEIIDRAIGPIKRRSDPK